MSLLNLKNTYQAVTSTWESAELSLGDILSFSPQTLLYVYPQDNTPWCTLENTDFSQMLSHYKELSILPIGVSKNSVESHKKFIEQHNLKIDLISDPELELHKELWAYGEKNNYGKVVTGVIRSTFLVDSNGKILKEWKNVKATGHADRIYKELQESQK